MYGLHTKKQLERVACIYRSMSFISQEEKVDNKGGANTRIQGTAKETGFEKHIVQKATQGISSIWYYVYVYNYI